MYRLYVFEKIKGSEEEILFALDESPSRTALVRQAKYYKAARPISRWLIEKFDFKSSPR